MTNPLRQIMDNVDSIRSALTGEQSQSYSSRPFVNPLNQIRDDVADIAEAVAEGGGGSSANPQYGTCSTAASTLTKDVVCEGFELVTGARIVVKFANANTQASPMLNVNSTGAKSVYVNGAVVSSSENHLRWTANTLLSFVYDGTYWHLEDKATCIFANSSTTASTATKETSTPSGVHIINGTIVNVLFTTANTSESKLKLNVNGSGANDVYYKGNSTGASNKIPWEANSVVTFARTGAYWYCIGVDKELSA